MVPVWTGADLGQRVEQPGLAVLAMVQGGYSKEGGGGIWISTLAWILCAITLCNAPVHSL